MDRLIGRYQSMIDELYLKLPWHQAYFRTGDLKGRLVYEKEVASLLKAIFSWYGPVSISKFGYNCSLKAGKLILVCDSDYRFQNLYLHMMLQNRNDYHYESISELQKKLSP
jgi:hypothetical protein